MSLSIGHTPDADDAFMFHAMFNGLVDTEGLSFADHLEPMAELNKKALKGAYDVTALSVARLPEVTGHYDLLTTGACMAETRGPVLLVRKGATPETIAVPGFSTTACLTARLHSPDAQFIEHRFDQILAALDENKFPAGVLITEDQVRFDKDRYDAIDLGAWWLALHGLPLPLGVDLIRRDLPSEIKNTYCRVFRNSIRYAIDHADAIATDALKFGRGIDQKPGLSFIQTFVNDYTIDLGDRGQQAIQCFFEECHQHELISTIPTLRFVDGR